LAVLERSQVPKELDFLESSGTTIDGRQLIPILLLLVRCRADSLILCEELIDVKGVCIKHFFQKLCSVLEVLVLKLGLQDLASCLSILLVFVVLGSRHLLQICYFQV
jgi:hypothetical protein